MQVLGTIFLHNIVGCIYILLLERYTYLHTFFVVPSLHHLKPLRFSLQNVNALVVRWNRPILINDDEITVQGALVPVNAPVMPWQPIRPLPTRPPCTYCTSSLSSLFSNFIHTCLRKYSCINTDCLKLYICISSFHAQKFIYMSFTLQNYLMTCSVDVYSGDQTQ